MGTIVLEFLANQLLSNLEAQLRDFRLQLSHGRGALTIDGLLGLIGLLGLTALIAVGLWRQLQTTPQPLKWSPWTTTQWSEVSLGLNLALLICALSTTVQEFSPVNQWLIGLIAGSACVACPRHIGTGMLENQPH